MAENKQRKIKDVARKLNQLGYDIKAEAVVSDLLKNGFVPDSIVIEFDSAHKRNWAKDILKAELKAGKIHLRLSRDGFIHSMPEYLFMKPVNEGNENDINQIIEFNKQQESTAQILFNPIENEIFQQGVGLDTFENDQIAAFNSGDNESIRKFWRLNLLQDETDQAKLCRIIPNLLSIVGNFPLTAKCLEYLLDQTVTWEMEERKVFLPPDRPDEESYLGNYICGDNFITFGIPEKTSSTLVFTIGPVPGEHIPFYLNNGKKKQLIDYFVGYFIPLQYEVDICLIIQASDSKFKTDLSFLGFNTTL